MARRVLVVDDAELAGMTLLRIVKRGGWDGRWASSATEAEAVASEWRPAAVIVDRNLPDGDGLDLAARLRVLLPDATVVMLSGDPLEPSSLGAVDGFLLKPASARAVLEALERS